MDIAPSSCQTIKSCRISNSEDLIKVLDLGIQPLANSLKKKSKDEEERYPLTLSFSSKSCLLQLNETINKEKLFDRYIWVTSTSLTAKNYAKTCGCV